MRLRDIARLRLRVHRLGLGGSRFESAEEVVGWLGAVQSQEYGLARWSLAMRTGASKSGGLVESDVESAIASGKILRTHILRPTWHFVLPRDIRWMMRLTGPRWDPVVTRRNGQLGLLPRDVTRALDLIAAALAGGAHLTRPELGAAIKRGGVGVDGQRLAFIVMTAETSLLVASGAPKGTVQTYALLDERAPSRGGSASFDRDKALADLALRYFTSHGPATVGDFCWWSTLTVADARRGIAANGSALEKLTVDGTDYWWAGNASDSDGPDDRSPTFHLLQGFDEYLVGYRSPRTPTNVDGLGPATGLGIPSWLHGVFLDGQHIGQWRRVIKREELAIEVRLFRELSTREKSGLESAVDRYARFVGRPVGLSATQISGHR